jgi:succinate dehydrogenase assembly factor 1
MKLSGLQKDVLKLYRELLRTARKKDPTFLLAATVSIEFRKRSSTVTRKEVNRIEHMIRAGHKQHKLMQMQGFTTIQNPAI